MPLQGWARSLLTRAGTGPGARDGTLMWDGVSDSEARGAAGTGPDSEGLGWISRASAPLSLVFRIFQMGTVDLLKNK